MTSATGNLKQAAEYVGIGMSQDHGTIAQQGFPPHDNLRPRGDVVCKN